MKNAKKSIIVYTLTNEKLVAFLYPKMKIKSQMYR